MEPFQFVDNGHMAQILCVSTEKISSGIFFSWYKRRENGIPVLVEDCSHNNSKKNSLSSIARFTCKAEEQRIILEISNVETEDSGIYLCATRYSGFLSFSNGSSLVVGGKQGRLNVAVEKWASNATCDGKYNKGQKDVGRR